MSRGGGRILALDPGARRTGVALSDPAATVASPRGVIEHRSREELVEEVVGLVETLARAAEDDPRDGVGGIVLGSPRHMSGEESAGSAAVEVLAGSLRDRLGLPVWCWDERLSTRAARAALIAAGASRRTRRRNTDPVAATLILQSFLESRDRGKEPAGG